MDMKKGEEREMNILDEEWLLGPLWESGDQVLNDWLE